MKRSTQQKIGKSRRTGTLTVPELVWLACFLDCEGSLVVVPLWSHRARRPRYQARIIIVNSNMAMLERAADLFWTFGCEPGNVKHSAGTGTKKLVRRVTVQNNKAVARILAVLSPFLMEKKSFADRIASLFSRHEDGRPWTDAERAEAEEIRRQFMPRSKSAKRAIGEAPAARGEVIPSEAAEGTAQADGSAERVETTGPSPNSNDPHERPGTPGTVLH